MRPRTVVGMHFETFASGDVPLVFPACCVVSVMFCVFAQVVCGLRMTKAHPLVALACLSLTLACGLVSLSPHPLTSTRTCIVHARACCVHLDLLMAQSVSLNVCMSACLWLCL